MNPLKDKLKLIKVRKVTLSQSEDAIEEAARKPEVTTKFSEKENAMRHCRACTLCGAYLRTRRIAKVYEIKGVTQVSKMTGA